MFAFVCFFQNTGFEHDFIELLVTSCCLSMVFARLWRLLMVSSHTCQSFQVKSIGSRAWTTWHDQVQNIASRAWTKSYDELKSVASRAWTKFHDQANSVTSQKHVGGMKAIGRYLPPLIPPTPPPHKRQKTTKKSQLLAQIKQRNTTKKNAGCQAVRSLRGPMFNDLE